MNVRDRLFPDRRRRGGRSVSPVEYRGARGFGPWPSDFWGVEPALLLGILACGLWPPRNSTAILPFADRCRCSAGLRSAPGLPWGRWVVLEPSWSAAAVPPSIRNSVRVAAELEGGWDPRFGMRRETRAGRDEGGGSHAPWVRSYADILAAPTAALIADPTLATRPPASSSSRTGSRPDHARSLEVLETKSVRNTGWMSSSQFSALSRRRQAGGLGSK